MISRENTYYSYYLRDKNVFKELGSTLSIVSRKPNILAIAVANGNILHNEYKLIHTYFSHIIGFCLYIPAISIFTVMSIFKCLAGKGESYGCVEAVSQ